MNVRAWAIGGAAAAVLTCAALPAGAELAPALQQVMESNLASFNRKDLAGTMATIHTKSPDYASTQAVLQSQFQDLDVTTKMLDFDLIGHDDEFAVARAKVQTTGKPGSGFADNTVDAIMVFHQEGGAWKLWDEDVLGVQIP